MNLTEKEHSFGSKMSGMMIVVGLHLLLAYAILTGLNTVIRKIIVEPPVILLPADPPRQKPVEPDLPKVGPKLTKPVDVPTPEVPVVTTQSTILAEPSKDIFEVAESSGDGGTGTGSGPVVVNPVVDFGTCDKPEYPASALRNQEEGVSRLAFLIDVDGSIAQARVQSTSGHRVLDIAALRALSLCRFKPGSANGQPYKTWASVDYAWKLVQ